MGLAFQGVDSETAGMFFMKIEVLSIITDRRSLGEAGDGSDSFWNRKWFALAVTGGAVGGEFETILLVQAGEKDLQFVGRDRGAVFEVCGVDIAKNLF